MTITITITTGIIKPQLSKTHILQRAPTGSAASELITVWEAILTGRQTREKLQCFMRIKCGLLLKNSS